MSVCGEILEQAQMHDKDKKTQYTNYILGPVNFLTCFYLIRKIKSESEYSSKSVHGKEEKNGNDLLSLLKYNGCSGYLLPVVSHFFMAYFYRWCNSKHDLRGFNFFIQSWPGE